MTLSLAPSTHNPSLDLDRVVRDAKRAMDEYDRRLTRQLVKLVRQDFVRRHAHRDHPGPVPPIQQPSILVAPLQVLAPEICTGQDIVTPDAGPPGNQFPFVTSEDYFVPALPPDRVPAAPAAPEPPEVQRAPSSNAIAIQQNA